MKTYLYYVSGHHDDGQQRYKTGLRSEEAVALQKSLSLNLPLLSSVPFLLHCSFRNFLQFIHMWGQQSLL